MHHLTNLYTLFPQLHVHHVFVREIREIHAQGHAGPSEHLHPLISHHLRKILQFSVFHFTLFHIPLSMCSSICLICQPFLKHLCVSFTANTATQLCIICNPSRITFDHFIKIMDIASKQAGSTMFPNLKMAPLNLLYVFYLLSILQNTLVLNLQSYEVSLCLIISCVAPY